MTTTDEPIGRDHSEGLLILRWIRGRLALLRARNLRDADDRGGRFE
jgi:hypothetical protein